MMTWDYRVFREDNGEYVIREVFYDDDGSIIGCTENAVEPMGESLAELAKDIEWFKEALKLPILTLADMPRSTNKKRKKDRGKNLSLEHVTAELGLSKSSARRPTAPLKNGRKKIAVASEKKPIQRMHARQR